MIAGSQGERESQVRLRALLKVADAAQQALDLDGGIQVDPVMRRVQLAVTELDTLWHGWRLAKP